MRLRFKATEEFFVCHDIDFSWTGNMERDIDDVHARRLLLKYPQHFVIVGAAPIANTMAPPPTAIAGKKGKK